MCYLRSKVRTKKVKNLFAPGGNSRQVQPRPVPLIIICHLTRPFYFDIPPYCRYVLAGNDGKSDRVVSAACDRSDARDRCEEQIFLNQFLSSSPPRNIQLNVYRHVSSTIGDISRNFFTGISIQTMLGLTLDFLRCPCHTPFAVFFVAYTGRRILS